MGDPAKERENGGHGRVVQLGPAPRGFFPVYREDDGRLTVAWDEPVLAWGLTCIGEVVGIISAGDSGSPEAAELTCNLVGYRRPGESNDDVHARMAGGG